MLIQCINNLAGDDTASLYIIDLLSITRHDLLEVNWETRATIVTIVDKLRKVHQRCLDDPTYTVALPRPRKPPWSPSTYNNQTPKALSQTPQTLANMDSDANSSERNYGGLMTASGQDFYFQELNENFQTNDTSLNFSKMPFEESTFTADFSTDFLTLGGPVQQELPVSQNITCHNNTTKAPANRKRNFDDKDNNCMDYSSKKKQRIDERLQKYDTKEFKPTKNTSQGDSKTSSKSSNPITEKEFPCPFYHQRPDIYCTKAWRACTMPTWTISRLKFVLHLVV